MLLLSFSEKFLTDVLYQKFCGRVPSLALRVGLYATRRENACIFPTFRCYPSRGYVRVPIRTRIRVRHAEGMRSMVQRTEAIAQPVARRLRSRNAQKINILYNIKFVFYTMTYFASQDNY